MTKCEFCEKEFPSELIQLLVTDKGEAMICAICADEVIGGLQGDISTWMLEKTQKYLRGEDWE